MRPALIAIGLLLALTSPALADLRWAMIDSGNVVRYVWITPDGDEPQAPAGMTAVQDLSATASVGGSYSAGVFSPPPLSAQQQSAETYGTNIAAGIQITSNGSPALNGTYALDPTSISDVQIVAALLANNKGLPSGTATFKYPDAAGNMHVFSSITFLNFAQAMNNYVYALKQAQNGQQSWPASNQVTIP